MKGQQFLFPASILVLTHRYTDSYVLSRAAISHQVFWSILWPAILPIQLRKMCFSYSLCHVDTTAIELQTMIVFCNYSK